MKLINIKIVGYCFVLLGLAILCLPAYPEPGTFKAMAIRQLQSMPQQETYNRGDLIPAMQKVAVFSWQMGRGSPPLVDALIILIGAILIDVGSRQKRASEKQPNPALVSN